MFTESEIIEQLDSLHQAERFQDLVNFVDSLRPEQKTAKILGLQARACNNIYWQETIPENRHFAERALSILLDLESELSHEASWQFRIAYAYFYLGDKDKAEYHFKISNDIEPFDIAVEFINIIHFARENDLEVPFAQDIYYEQQSGENEDFFDMTTLPSANYSQSEQETFLESIQEKFGGISGVFRAENECEIFLIKPSDDIPVHTLISFGMGATAMAVPDDSVPKFAELLLHLPADWDFQNPDNMWVIEGLQRLAKLTTKLQTFVTGGHTIPFAEKIDNVPFDCYLLVENLEQMRISDEKNLQIYHVMLLYPEERLFKLNNGISALFECFDDVDLPFPPILDLKRPNSCPEYQPMALGVESLDNILWRFDQTEYSSLMNFWQALQDYHQDIDCMEKLDKFEPFEIACQGEVYVVYDTYLTNTNVLNENETLLTPANFDDEDEIEAEILLKIVGHDKSYIGMLELLYYIHDNLTNKELGDHVFFEGLELDEQLTKQYQKNVYRVLLGS